jgi:ribulose-phosphate 3-epimerase
MTVNPGFGGQSLIPAALQKAGDCVQWLKTLGYNIPVQVDGGIDEKTAKKAKDLGISILVAGSYVFRSNDRKKAIQSLKNC